MGPFAGDVHDNGNAVDTDACVSGCKAAACGDTLVQAGVEECDDGNINGGDGCSAACKVEPMPAECINPTQLTEANRNVTFNDGDGNVEICDNSFLNVWYRFTGAAGVMMPTVVQPLYACGSDAPGWLNGAHPTVNEGVVDRTVCFNWNGNPCNWTAAVQVRNCGGYYVYKLPAASPCVLRYCGTN